MKYNKLVRNNIPNMIEGKGLKVKTHTANDDEYFEKLKGKLNEEVNEFIKESSKEELADILEVIDAICDFKEINKEELKKIKEQKAKERGKFDERIILDETNE